MKRALRVLGAGLLAWSLTACSWREDGVEWSHQRAAQRSLSIAAKSGFPARVLVYPQGSDLVETGRRLRAADATGKVTFILVSPDGVQLDPSAPYARAVPVQTRHAFERYAIADYVHSDDMDGAAQAAAREYLAMLTEFGAVDMPVLPMVDASAVERTSLPFCSARWGTPLALMLALAAWWLHVAGAAAHLRRGRRVVGAGERETASVP